MTPVGEENRWPDPVCSAQDARSDGALDEAEWDVDIEVDLGSSPDNAEECALPEKATRREAMAANRRDDKPSTQASAFVREEMHHKASQKHGAMPRRLAIAIGLSKAREAGIRVPPNARSKH